EVEMQFYGNQHFRLKSPGGKVILINPWIKGNKDAPFGVDHYKKGEVDLILATAGHGDDVGQSADIAANTGATVFASGELAAWLAGQIEKKGGSKKQAYGGGPGGRYKLGDITVQMLQAVHSSGISAENRRYGGIATGYLITFEDGLKVLMAGSTGLTLDLQLFGMRYQPHVALIPIAGRYMMHPDDAAYAAKLLMTDNPNLKTVVPQHFRVKGRPDWMGTPEQFAAEIKNLGLDLEVLSPEIGKTYTLSK
ncbi:MAG: metal-dependent hydrolase, partial [Proteobacteria bacterium]|nr:metal-dependent hydrolase [Pseudomonadota bacterium]